MRMRLALAVSLFVVFALPAAARPSSARHVSQHHFAPAEVLSADDLNAMVLGILAGQPPPVPSGSHTRQQQMQTAWERLHGILEGPRAS